MQSGNNQTQADPSLPWWLKKFLDWRKARREKEIAKLDAELVRVNRELAAVQEKNKELERAKALLNELRKQ